MIACNVKSVVIDRASEPVHYTWIGEALMRVGAPTFTANLRAWDLLDAIFPDNPHLWNAGEVPHPIRPQGRRKQACRGLAQGHHLPRAGH